jgi:hypothetical protein
VSFGARGLCIGDAALAQRGVSLALDAWSPISMNRPTHLNSGYGVR